MPLNKAIAIFRSLRDFGLAWVDLHREVARENEPADRFAATEADLEAAAEEIRDDCEREIEHFTASALATHELN
jgi:hypothetical protein